MSDIMKWNRSENIDEHRLRYSPLREKIESILFSRALEKRLYGYTLETSLEIAEAVEAADEIASLRALNEELVGALGRLTRWSKCFVEDTPISAETLWRGFPQAIKEADALLARIKDNSNG